MVRDSYNIYKLGEIREQQLEFSSVEWLTDTYQTSTIMQELLDQAAAWYEQSRREVA